MASAQTEPSMDEILASIRRIISEEDDAPEVPVRQKLETLHLAEDAPSVEAIEEAVTGEAAEDAKGGEPAAQIREVAREDDQPEEAPKAEKSKPKPRKAEAAAPEPAAEEADDALDDFDPLPEAAATGGSTMEPAAAAHDEGEVRDDTFDDTPEAVHDAPAEAAAPEAAAPETVKPETDDTEDAPVSRAETAAPADSGVVRSIGDAVRPAAMAAAAEKMTVNAGAARQAADAFGALEENVRISAGNGRTIEDLVEQMLAPMLSAWLDENLPRIVEDKVEEEVRRIARRR